MLPIPIVFTLMGLISLNYCDYSEPISLVVGILTYTVTYLILFFLFGMNKLEKELFIKPILRFVKL